MNCELLTERLDDLIDGTLPSTEVAAAERHAATCPACAGELEMARRIAGLARDLSRSVEPATDLWPAIGARLVAKDNVVRGHFGRGLRSWLAVAAVITAAVGSVVVAYTVGRQQAHPVVVERYEPPLAVPASSGGGSMSSVDAQFQEARDELLQALSRREDQLSPETTAVVFDNLRVIDAAISRISTALGDDPDNPMLTGQLTRAYQQQIQLLRRANRLPAEI
jgi:hypothetical protein